MKLHQHKQFVLGFGSNDDNCISHELNLGLFIVLNSLSYILQ